MILPAHFQGVGRISEFAIFAKIGSKNTFHLSGWGGVNVLLNVAPGQRMAMTRVGVSFLTVGVFTQQSKQPNPN